MRLRWDYVAITLIIIVALAIGTYAAVHPHQTKEIIVKWGYVGLFFAVLITNATLFIGSIYCSSRGKRNRREYGLLYRPGQQENIREKVQGVLR